MGFESQLSETTGFPVLDGSELSVQVMLISAGAVIVGFITSRKVIVCVPVAEFPHASSMPICSCYCFFAGFPITNFTY